MKGMATIIALALLALLSLGCAVTADFEDWQFGFVGGQSSAGFDCSENDGEQCEDQLSSSGFSEGIGGAVGDAVRGVVGIVAPGVRPPPEPVPVVVSVEQPRPPDE